MQYYCEMRKFAQFLENILILAIIDKNKCTNMCIFRSLAYIKLIIGFILNYLEIARSIFKYKFLM